MIKPTKRIYVAKPDGEKVNPFYLEIQVSDDEARNAVNSLSSAPWARGDRCYFAGETKIIPEDRYHGYLVVNKCFDVADAIEEIENCLSSFNK